MPETMTAAARDADSLDLRAHIRGIPDFPKPGILFYDISTLLRHGPAWAAAMARLGRAIRPYKPDMLAGIESRGFLIAAPLALELGLGFIMLRKRGKLPGETVGLDYALEYGTDRIEMQADAVEPGQRVVLLDDLLATGGTMAAGVRLLRERGRRGAGGGGADRADLPPRPRPPGPALRNAAAVRVDDAAAAAEARCRDGPSRRPAGVARCSAAPPDSPPFARCPRRPPARCCPSIATFLVPGPENGPHERWSSRLAAFLGRGASTAVNVTCAVLGGPDGVTAANRFAAQVEPDGRTLLVLSGGAALARLVGDPRARFETARLAAGLRRGGPGRRRRPHRPGRRRHRPPRARRRRMRPAPPRSAPSA